jgi:hypothetical protein
MGELVEHVETQRKIPRGREDDSDCVHHVLVL